jgi:hypothetical protein
MSCDRASARVKARKRSVLGSMSVSMPSPCAKAGARAWVRYVQMRGGEGGVCACMPHLEVVPHGTNGEDARHTLLLHEPSHVSQQPRAVKGGLGREWRSVG